MTSPAVRQAEALFGLGDLLEQGCGLAAADGAQLLALGWSGTEARFQSF